MKHALEKQENLELKQAQIVAVLTENGKVSGVRTQLAGDSVYADVGADPAVAR